MTPPAGKLVLTVGTKSSAVLTMISLVTREPRPQTVSTLKVPKMSKPCPKLRRETCVMQGITPGHMKIRPSDRESSRKYLPRQTPRSLFRTMQE